MFLKYKRESFEKMILFRIFAAAAAATAAVAETVPPAEPVLPETVDIEPVVTELEEVATIEESIGYFQYIMQIISDWFAAEHQNLISFLIGIGVTLLVTILVYLFIKHVLLRIARKTPGDLDVLILTKINAPVTLLVLLLGLSGCNKLVNFPGSMDLWLAKLLYACFILCILWGIFRIIGIIEERFRQRVATTGCQMNNLLVDLVRRAVLIAVWIMAVIFIAQNLFNLNVTALLTGAGVAGLAVAFAAQNTIANMFGAVSLISDKAFQIGDRVIIGEIDGIIESVGFRSTRIRALDGTIWNLPNRVAADGTINNISRRPNIKHSFTLNLTYDTTPEKMRRALEILNEIFASHPGFDAEKNPPIIHFSDFQAYSLDINVIIWFQTTDWNEFVKWKQEVNFAILERFNAEGLEFAFPTSTNYLINQGA